MKGADMRIVETDNFNGDYPDEKFLNIPPMSEDHARLIAAAINEQFPQPYPRWWKAVPNDYVLQPGFEP